MIEENIDYIGLYNSSGDYRRRLADLSEIDLLVSLVPKIVELKKIYLVDEYTADMPTCHCKGGDWHRQLGSIAAHIIKCSGYEYGFEGPFGIDVFSDGDNLSDQYFFIDVGDTRVSRLFQIAYEMIENKCADFRYIIIPYQKMKKIEGVEFVIKDGHGLLEKLEVHSLSLLNGIKWGASAHI
jgi:hypothetical protein